MLGRILAYKAGGSREKYFHFQEVIAGLEELEITKIWMVCWSWLIDLIVTTDIVELDGAAGLSVYDSYISCYREGSESY